MQEDDTVRLPEPEKPSNQQPAYQPKLAPWAKMTENVTTNSNQSNLSLAEIQKLEEEREREAKMRRDIQEANQARVRQEEEARRQQVSLRSVFDRILTFYLFSVTPRSAS